MRIDELTIATLVLAGLEAAMLSWKPPDKQGAENAQYLALHYLVPLVLSLSLLKLDVASIVLAAGALFLFYAYSKRAGLGPVANPIFIACAVCIAAFFYFAFRRSTLLYQSLPIASFFLLLAISAFQGGGKVV